MPTRKDHKILKKTWKITYYLPENGFAFIVRIANYPVIKKIEMLNTFQIYVPPKSNFINNRWTY